MQVDLSGKVSLVTGAAGGIGQAIADRLAASGSHVIYSDRQDATAAAAKSPGAVAMTMDVTDRAQIESTIGRIVETYGHLDILVNNAGVNTMKHRVTFDEFPARNGIESWPWTWMACST